MLNGLAVALAGDEQSIARANRSWARQGFTLRGEERFEYATVWGFVSGEDTGAQGSPSAWSVRTAVGFACGVGPIWYRRRFGLEALRRLLGDAGCATGGSVATLERSSLRGNYAIFLCTRAGSWLLNDPLGLQRLYRAADNRYFATSWLAARAYTGDGRIDEGAAIEYVLQGSSHSERTVARSV